MPELPRTREQLIDAHLSDDDIVEIITALRERVAKYGDVQAARLLLEFKYGKNPEPVQTGETLDDLMMQSPLAPRSDAE